MRFELDISPLDLDLTLGCGQTFRWSCLADGSWAGVLGNQFVKIKRKGSTIEGDATPGGSDVESLVANFLRAKDDISRIQLELGKDPIIALGMRKMRGLRIVKLDEWECLISYILATYANIPRIMKMVDSVASEYGRKIAPGVHAFPERRLLAKASVGELAKLGLGYRAKYVHLACREIDEPALAEMMETPYESLRTGLIELPGVGEKVADCVSLFGFGRLESFPIDVWIQRALLRLYGVKGSYPKLRHFAIRKFGCFAGYAQEYLFHNERTMASKGACAFSNQ